jgi:hypothetical protein
MTVAICHLEGEKRVASVGRHGAMKPEGISRRERRAGAAA